MIGQARARVLAAVAGLVMSAAAAFAQTDVRVPPEAAALAGQHPAEYYKSAADLFGGGRRDDAVFVFYLGQLRYRVHLVARPDLRPDGDPALFASLQEVMGRPINEYAFGDIPALARTLEAVLAYDGANPDRFTPPAQFGAAHADIRRGLEGMRDLILRDAESIRATRSRNGLENRN